VWLCPQVFSYPRRAAAAAAQQQAPTEKSRSLSALTRRQQLALFFEKNLP